MADRFINISREQSEKSSSSLLLTFSCTLFLSTFSLLSFFLFSHIRERERDGERERESFLSSFGEGGGRIIRCSLSLSLSLSLFLSLSRCDAYRSDRRECRPRERREKATAASTSEI